MGQQQLGIKKEKGFLTLMSVLLVGAIGLVVSVSLVLLGLAYSKTSFSLQQSSQARGLANACAEEALEQIRLSSTYTGSGKLRFGQDDCSYAVTNTGVETQIISNGTVGTIVRRNTIIVNAINPLIVLSSWQETAN